MYRDKTLTTSKLYLASPIFISSTFTLTTKKKVHSCFLHERQTNPSLIFLGKSLPRRHPWDNRSKRLFHYKKDRMPMEVGRIGTPPHGAQDWMDIEIHAQLPCNTLLHRVYDCEAHDDLLYTCKQHKLSPTTRPQHQYKRSALWARRHSTYLKSIFIIVWQFTVATTFDP